MPFQSVPLTAQFTLVFQLPNGQYAVNTFHVQNVNDEWNEEALAFKATDLLDWWDESMQPVVSSQVSVLRVEAKSLEAEVAPVAVVTPAAPLVGGSSSPAMPSNCSLAVAWKTGYSGRSAQGRTYHIGLSEAQVAGDYVNAGDANGLQTRYATLIPALNSGTAYVFSVVSRWSNGVMRPMGHCTPISSCVLNDRRIDSQRRRLPRTTL